MENFRPVSHLVEVGQLVEQAVYFQVVDHFLSNHLFHRNHHGGLPSHSTTSALIQLNEMFLEAAEQKKLSAALLLDQSAAYDLLDHKILLNKLALYNFDEQSIQWFSSYLRGRSQSVQIEAKQSTSEQLGDHAAPQGSVLGGLLFIINENDFPACRVAGESVLYVDDDTDVVSDTNPDNLVMKIQREADLSCAWLKDNRMVVAGDKSKLLIVGTKELRKSKLGEVALSISVDGKRVTETRSEKLLGVIINNQMTWREHLYGEDWRTEKNSPGLISQLSQRLGILRKLSKHSSKQKLKVLASGLFYSKLSYCLPLFTNTWGLDNYKNEKARFTSYTKADNRRLQVLQNQVCRLLLPLDRQTLYYKQNLPTNELLEKCGSLSIHQLGAQRTLVMVKKVQLSQKPCYIAEKLGIRQLSSTRLGSTIPPLCTDLTIRKSGFLYRGAKLFNQLPADLKAAQKITQFKKGVKTWVKQNIPVKP